MLVSFRRLTKKMTDHFLSQITRASFNSCAGASHKMEIKQHAVCDNGLRDTSYEAAVKALHNLQSNAETIAKSRQNMQQKVIHNIPNMIQYIIRSGLTMEEVDKLSVIHISGTKGKGSTCAFSERILYCHGYKTGLFTSPHMIEVRERIRINGRPISQEMFSKYFWKVYNSLQMTQTEFGVGSEDGGGMPPYFAFLTVLSLHVFLSEDVDVAVFEVGIGGQYDSTNFFRKPIVCGVTSLGLDHTALLGNTIAEIAWNKAGIFKPGRPAITVQHEEAALEVLLKRAHEIQNPLYIAKEMPSQLIQTQDIKLGIAGSKQSENASLAIQLCRMWEHLHKTGEDMTGCTPGAVSPLEEIPQLEVLALDDATLKGLSSCVWPGRAQTIHRESVTYYLDGAHTKESMEVCAQWFEEATEKDMKTESGKKYARILLFNATSDRDVSPLLACLTGCNFDAALFCTNLLSVVEAFNRADQLNKTVTPRGMMEKVDLNKRAWDELMVKNRHDSAIQEDFDYRSCQLVTPNGDTHHNGFRGASDANNCNSGFPEHEPSKAHDDAFSEVMVNYDHEKEPVTKFNVPNGISVNSQSESVYQVRRICSTTHKNLPADQKNILKETENNNTFKDTEIKDIENHFVLSHDTSSLGYGKQNGLSQIGTLNNHSCLVETITEKQLAINSVLSLKFPCILQALAWATQGRDPSVKVNDPEFVLPPIPEQLLDADHIQVLITGSLHLVGGVLGVVDPHMND